MTASIVALEDLADAAVLVVGIGESGLAAAERLCRLGARVTAADEGSAPELEERARYLEKLGAAVILGGRLKDPAPFELIVASPGVPDTRGILKRGSDKEVPIWSEVELAYRLSERPIIGITGTNGKTTTATLVGAMLERAGLKTRVAGNIGLPLVKAVEDGRRDGYLVAELSSFQLKNIDTFKPHIGVLLNVAPDHLDWHPDFNDYLQAKLKLFENQGGDGFAVVNGDDPRIEKDQLNTSATVLEFSRKRAVDKGVGVENGQIVWRLDREVQLGRVEAVKLMGAHNTDNVLAAAAAAMAVGASAEAVRAVAGSFTGLPHRLEYVGRVNGVNYYNDSKATNPAAAAGALRAFEEPVVLIAGGRNKGNDLFELARVAGDRAKASVFFGESAAQLAAASAKEAVLRVASSLEEAVKTAAGLAGTGEVVLLSPGCASFDQFSGYAARGDAFRRAVAGLKEGKKSV